MKMCFTGDAIMLSPPTDTYWNNNQLLDIIKSCDVRGSNLEMVLSGNKAFASTFCGGQWLTTTSDRLRLLLRFGFDYLNTANNHTMDFSYYGMQLTNSLLDESGIAHSGSGDSLEAASKAVVINRKGKKISFISCTASCDDSARAGAPSKNIPARPGVNMLRHSERLILKAADLAVIDRIANDTCINARFLKSVKMGTHFLDKKIHRLGRLEFEEGSENKKITYCNQSDLWRITSSVEDAKHRSDYVIVNVHSHDIKGFTDDTADYYLEEFAHACIDSGANAVIGTGTHQLKGIEIYKSSPIFYSLGNFMFKYEIMEYSPQDIFERYNVTNCISPEEFYLIRSKNGTVGLEFDPYNYRSVVPILEFNDNLKLIDLNLIPIELGFDGYNKGFPVIASNDVSEEIYNRLCKLSNDYSTCLKMNNGKIKIEI